MNGKSSNISKWVFGALALVTVVIAVMFYLVVGNVKPAWLAGDPTPRTDLFLNWGYILIILGIVLAVISALFAAVVKGVNVKVLLILIAVIAINAVLAYIMSRGVSGPYTAGDVTYSAPTHFKVEFGLNFFYITLAESLLCILFSVIYKAVKK